MRKRVLCTALTASMALAVCGSPASAQTTAVPGTEEASFTESETQTIGEQKNQDITEAETKAPGESYKIGIVTPTFTVSEDELRDAQEVVRKYPDLVVYKTFPESFATDKEDYISVITSSADDPEMEHILFDNGMEGIVSAFRTIKERRPDTVTIVTNSDDPKFLNDYADISVNTGWIRRGETIPTKAHNMRAKTFIHCSFLIHTAAENKAKRRDVTKEACEKLGTTWVEEITPDPQTSNGTAAMLQFLRRDIPRKIKQYGPDVNIFGTNYPMYDAMLGETFKEKFIVAEQRYPTPTQAYPTVLNLEVTKEGLGDYSKINNLTVEKTREAGISERLSGWAMPSFICILQLRVELVKYMHDNSLSPEDVLDREFLNQFTSEYVPTAADLQVAGERLGHHYILFLEDIYYQDVRRL